MDPDTTEAIYHRTLTHSLFFALAVAIIFYLLSLVLSRSEIGTFGFGLATGMALLHTVIDIFAWFDAVGVFWPLWSIDLWGWFTTPEIISNLLRAGNFFAFAAYFAYLSMLAR
jgi:membrane-bound metal-dependent hydrolase YbcI (DUF457 family)